MITLTNGYELTTALTNAIIMIIAISGAIIMRKEKLWKLLFIFLAIDGFLGVIVHGIVMSQTTNNLLWMILLIMFALSINTALCIFSKCKTKYMIYLSILLTIVLLTELFIKLDFLSTFFIYAIIIVLLCLYFVLKSKDKNKYYILLSLLIMIASTIPEFIPFKVEPFNHDGVSHIILSIGVIILLLSIRKKNK